MARIQLDTISHSYAVPRSGQVQDWALRHLSLDWQDGGAYALLGPSGCGKTTLLNLISGLLRPTQGRILFDGRDVTQNSPQARNIAQVFQFPVVYDSMTVQDNLAFPLRNRGLGEAEVTQRVREVAALLDLTDALPRRARNLTADGKQKISLGRGLVRSDVSAILFDEPLTVIDPHLKWQLRSKLKELHQRLNVTMIYVTHDQTEALTFADQVVVMNHGVVMQIGTPVELFDRPHHTFVGHFIGSPGMNLLPASLSLGRVTVAGVPLALPPGATLPVVAPGQHLELGVRPEFVHLADRGLPARLTGVADAGRHRILSTQTQAGPVTLLSTGDVPPADQPLFLALAPDRCWLYVDGWIAGPAGGFAHG